MNRDPRKVVMIVSLLASGLMLAGKLTAYFITHSFAIFADAAESVVHGAATGLATFSVWYAARPADSGHPYGHGRIAYFSAGFEGALVIGASLAVIYSGVRGLILGPELRHLGIGLSIAGGLAIVNLILGTALVWIGKKHNSLIVEANGRHVLSDMWTTVAVIAGIGLVMLTGSVWLDPAVAILVGLYIAATGAALVRRSFGGLMDELDPTLSGRLIDGLRSNVHAGLIADFHQLRGRRMNDELWIDVHMLVPGELPMREAHGRVTRVEQSLRTLFPSERVRITTHIEPTDHAAAHPDGHPGIDDPLAS